MNASTSAAPASPASPSLNQDELSRTLTDLAECEREALQHIGKIQAHGCIVFFSIDDHRVQSASENVGDFLDVAHREVLGSRLEHLLDASFCEQIFETCESWQKAAGQLGVYISSDYKGLDGYLFESDGLFALELERSITKRDEQERARTQVEKVLRRGLLSLKEAKNLDELAQVVCRSIRSLTGLDRVMVYRFIPPSWYGQVIAEDRVVGAHSFSGHRFPASDIPRIARDLYLRNGLRVISDIQAREYELRPAMNPLTRKNINLTDSKLRASSPVHLEYLSNMKIRASISVAIVVQGQLWGLVACHHLKPYTLRRELRLACELIADAFAAQAPLVEIMEQQRMELEFYDRLHVVIESLRLSRQPVRDLIKNHLKLFETFNCSGLALIQNSETVKKIEIAGLTPTQSQIQKLLPFLQQRLERGQRDSLVIHNLGENMPEFKSLGAIASGMLAFTLPSPQQGFFLLFRPEQVETITWGGDPRKQLVNKNFEGRINPRTSFDAWNETVVGKSAHWRRYEIDGANLLNRIVFETFDSNQALLNSLQHALRNKHS